MYKLFDEYLKYMKENKDSFPSHVYDFAVDVNRHNLSSPHSLHDSWITSIIIKENRKSERPFDPNMTIEIEFLGQMHDRNIILRYSNVESYSFEGVTNPFNWLDTYHLELSDENISEV